MYPWMYRQLSQDYFNTEENLKKHDDSQAVAQVLEL